ncbi:MAG: hypothetical protein Q9170_005544 [Blastenia crenularia]
MSKLEEILRQLAAETEKRKVKNALAAGFATLEEYEQHELEEERQQEEAIDEHCLAKGITREQYDLEREEFLTEQIERHPKPKEHHCSPPMQNCDCEHHPFPLFCQKSLVEYKSQDFPDMIEYLGNRHYIDSEKVEIQETDRSRRLDGELLEQHWMRRPLDVPIRDVAPWFKTDVVVQQMMRQNACQDTPISPSLSPMRVPSLSYDDYPSGSPSAEEAVTDSIDTTMEIEAMDHNLRVPVPVLYPQVELLSQPDFQASSTKQPISQGRAEKLRQRRSGAPTKTEDWRANRGSGISKLSWKPAMGLRSRKVSKFYELGYNSEVKDYRR